MELYHVSVINKNKDVIDMKASVKNDMEFVGFLLNNIKEYSDFYCSYHSDCMKRCSNKKGWSVEKIASEAVFEYVRLTEYSWSPSRLMYTYFTDSVERAKQFNKYKREENGDYFWFDADEDKVYYYDMDAFDSAVKLLKLQGLTEQSFEELKHIARTYWLTSKDGNTEILYKGKPVLKNISKLIC